VRRHAGVALEQAVAVESELVEALSEREHEVLRLIAEGLSNREIADRLVLSPETIKWYNRQIYGKLGVDSRTKAVAVADQRGLLAGRPAEPAPASTAPVHHLPAQLTSFIGREAQLADVRRLMLDSRLVTLTGPGGTGKTRLALQAAEGIRDRFPYGVALVDLAPVRDPQLVPQAMLVALGVFEAPGQSAAGALIQHLKSKRLLLLLDNFDQVVEAAPLLHEILQAAPELSLLVTSREALRVYGEQIYEVPPLGLPDEGDLAEVSTAAASEAMALFIERARAVRSDFALTLENAPVVARICARLDGLPLAIELAAARVRLLPLERVSSEIDERLMDLSTDLHGVPERQRTLQATIAWSHALLDEGEKRLFARLSVFDGGRTIDAVQQVCGTGLTIDVIEGLESLVNKSLLSAIEEPPGEMRFVFLETVHAFASEQLRAAGEVEAMRRRHAAYFADLVEAARFELRGGGRQMAWLCALESDHANLLEALKWAFDGGDLEIGLRLVAGLAHFWYRQGYWHEGEHWTARALENLEGAPEAIQASVYQASGSVSLMLSARERGQRMHRRAIEIYRRLGDRRELGWNLVLLAAQSIGVPPEYEDALEACEEGMQLLWDVDDMPGIAQGYNVIGELARSVGDRGRARTAYTEALEIARKQGDALRESMNLCNLSFLTLDDGDAVESERLMLEGMKAVMEPPHVPQLICGLIGMAGPLAAQGELERAARLFGAADELLDRYGQIVQVGDQPVFDAYRAAVEGAMSAEDYAAAYESGAKLTLDEATALACQE
jgi:predicted ATPase/DNA-binding CsgD family transcriptional regulator